MIVALEHLSEGALPNLLNDLKAEADLVVFGDSVVSVSIIIAVVDYTFGFACVDLVLVRCKIVDLFELSDFLHLRLS